MHQKRLAALFLSLLMTVTAGVTAVAAENDGTFSDVPTTHWAYNEIEYFASEKIIAGVGDGTFAPADGVTRESFVKMMVLTFHAPLESPKTPSFTDVLPDRWSYPYVEVSREFLTGYESPYDSTMTFRPTAIATREDVAVALVRMMGLTDKDQKNSSTYKKFDDYATISPGLVGYVNVAVEKGLISGIPGEYGSLSFGAQNSISRAETVVLLNRAAKSAVTNVDAALELETDLKSTDYGATATLTVTVPEGTTVTVNGEAMKLTSTSGKYVGTLVHKFTKEGDFVFTVVAKKAGKTKTETLTAEYSVDKPLLEITECPSESSGKTITIKGTMLDRKYSQTLKLNDTTVTTSSSINEKRTWSHSYTLAAGENTLTFVLTNSAGKATTVTRTVTYQELGPQLAITDCPATTDKKTITVKGTLTDANYSVSLTANGKDVYVSSDKTWKTDVTLSPGENTLKFVATNSAKKTATKTQTVTYTDGGPKIEFPDFPATTDRTKIELTFTATDANFSGYDLVATLNGDKYSCSSNKFYSNLVYKLNEGENTFTIVVTNPDGKSTTVEKKIVLTVPAPELSFFDWPSTTTVAKGTIMAQVHASDTNYSADDLTLSVNGTLLKDFNSSYWPNHEYVLTEGENTFVFVVTNLAGKSTTVTKTLTYVPAA